jgi:hypothetical protein
MKTRILIFCSITFIFASAYSQNKICDEVFKKYADKQGFTTINIPGSALKLFFHDLKDNEFKITEFRLLSAEDSIVNENINFYNEIVPKLKKHEYEELMSIKDKDQNFVMLCKNKNGVIIEFILISGGKDNLLVNFTGRISLSDAFKISQSLSDNDKLKELE